MGFVIIVCMKRSQKITVASVIVALLLAVAIILIIVLCPSTQTARKPAESDLNKLTQRLQGKNVSILGDSITTFEGYSDNQKYNSTLSLTANIPFYKPIKSASEVDNTWWMRVVKDLNANLLVNNSCGGLCILRPDGPDGVKRADNLHCDTGSLRGTLPDIVFVYLGTNDVFVKNEVGNFEDIRWDELVIENGKSYAEPQNVVEAYAIILHKIKTLYDNPDVFCLNVLENNATSTTKINSEIAKVAAYFGASLVDIANQSGITPKTLSKFTLDTTHPNDDGMKLIAYTLEHAMIAKYL